MGLGGLDVVNLFALRSTDPKALYGYDVLPVSEPGAPYKNDAIIEKVVRRAGMVICAWGKHGAHLYRDTIILQRLREWGVVPHALKVNLDGSPAHPLRIAYSVTPFQYHGRPNVQSSRAAGA